jgi:heptosyltransferase I
MAKSLLLVKTSSLGDVIHAMPAVSDFRSAFPDARIDWVVEHPYLALPRMHPAVSNAIPVAIRHWRRTWWRREVRAEIADSLSQIRERSYDAIVDAQGLLKSALVTFAGRGRRYGLDFHSSREPLALFYHRTFRISWQLHAVERNRLLLARVFGYDVPPDCNYGISAAPRRFDWLAPGAYAVLLHATSGDYKLWPEHQWLALGSALNDLEIGCVLPWGSESERARSARIAAGLRSTVVPPALGLDDFAGLLAGARAVVGIDTGLTHLAAALGTPTVGIYTATDPAATGIHGCTRARNIGGINKNIDIKQILIELQALAR